MKKRNVITMTALCMTALMTLTGCSGDNNTEQTNPGQTAGTTQSTSESTVPESSSISTSSVQNTQEAVTIADLISLIGQKDADVMALLGEGTSSADDAGNITAREYEFPFYGKDNLSAVSYDDAGDVSMISIYASEYDFEGWEKLVKDDLGDPDSTGSTSSEGSDSKEKIWNLDKNVIVSLKDAYGAVSLEIFKGE